MPGSPKPYSDFLRVDLHIHTDMSKKTKENDYKGIFSIQTVYEKMVENDVAIFSLTDHNIINVAAYKEYYETFTNDDEPLLLIGTELDINVGDIRYHSLIIFCHHDIENVNRINDALESYYTAKGLAPEDRLITLDHIVHLFPTDDFFFIPHAGNGSNSLVDAYKNEIPYAQKMLLLMPSCALEKVSQKAIAHYNGSFGKHMPETHRDRKDIAYIQFSDNHNIQKYPLVHKGEVDNPPHEFYYVKGGKNYETLRQAFIDPESRIKSETELAALPRNANHLEGLKITGCNQITDTHLTFSPHLNVIIGGRSSGKSLLMSMFGKCIDRLTADSSYDMMLSTATVQTKTKREHAYSAQSTLEAEPIWIKQGDIIHYFEQFRLDKLADKVGTKDDRALARQNLLQKKNELKDDIDALSEAYSEAYGSLNERSFVLHERTITESLSDEYTVKFERDTILEGIDDSTECLAEADKQFQAVLDAVDALKENGFISFAEEESQLIEAFKQLIQNKQQHYRKEGLVSLRREAFIEKVEKTLSEKNSELGSAAEDKTNAIRAIRNLAENLKCKFESAAKLSSISKKTSALSCHEIEEFDLHGGTRFVVEAKFDTSPNDVVLDAIKGADGPVKDFV